MLKIQFLLLEHASEFLQLHWGLLLSFLIRLGLDWDLTLVTSLAARKDLGGSFEEDTCSL